MIRFVQHGDFSKTDKFFEKVLEAVKLSDLDKYGRQGVEALRRATPKDSGKTAESWYYEIKHSNGGASIEWKNSNVNKGVNIAVILQYGHGTNHGGYVKGRDYINPAIQPLFDSIAEEAWKEVSGS